MLLSAIVLQAAAVSAWPKVGAAIASAMAAFAAGFGIGKIGSTTMECIARQPEQAGSMRSTMIIAAGMIEGAALFSIIVCLLVVI